MREFDETETNTIPTESISLPVITTKKSDNEFDDEWESWT